MKLSRVRFKQAVKLGSNPDTESFTEDHFDINVNFVDGTVSVCDTRTHGQVTILVPWSQVRQATQWVDPAPVAPPTPKRGPGRPPTVKEEPNG